MFNQKFPVTPLASLGSVTGTFSQLKLSATAACKIICPAFQSSNTKMAALWHTAGRGLPRSLRLTSLVAGGNLRLHRNAGDVPYTREPPIVAGKSVYKKCDFGEITSTLFEKSVKQQFLTGAVQRILKPARPLRITQ